jgi:hypothetical protein
MKQILFLAGFVLATISLSAQAWGLGTFNSYPIGGFNNGYSGYNNSFGNLLYNPFFGGYSYGYNGFQFSGDGVNLTINTPWGGGSLSFPISTLRERGVVTYEVPQRPKGEFWDIDYNYSYDNTALGSLERRSSTQTTTTTTTTTTTVTYHWALVTCQVTYVLRQKNRETGEVIDLPGERMYITKDVQQWVLVE